MAAKDIPNIFGLHINYFTGALEEFEYSIFLKWMENYVLYLKGRIWMIRDNMEEQLEIILYLNEFEINYNISKNNLRVWNHYNMISLKQIQ